MRLHHPKPLDLLASVLPLAGHGQQEACRDRQVVMAPQPSALRDASREPTGNDPPPTTSDAENGEERDAQRQPPPAGRREHSLCQEGPNSMLFKPLSARAVFQPSNAGTSKNNKFLHGPVMPPPPKLATLRQTMAPSKKAEPIKRANKRKHPSPTPPPHVSLSTTTCGSRLYEPFHNNQKARASELPKPAVEMMRPDENKQFLEAAVTLSSISRQGSTAATMASSSTTSSSLPHKPLPLAAPFALPSCRTHC